MPTLDQISPTLAPPSPGSTRSRHPLLYRTTILYIVGLPNFLRFDATRRTHEPGRIERHGFEYYRHATLSLYAALETATRRMHGKTAARHTSQDFVAFLEEVVAQCPASRQIHIILDNLSAHKTRLVDEFLQNNNRVQFHFTPTYSSWINQVELWFGKIERDLIARGVFTSVNDLAPKIRRYIKAYSANAKPIQWKYSDPNRRMHSVVSESVRYGGLG